MEFHKRDSKVRTPAYLIGPSRKAASRISANTNPRTKTTMGNAGTKFASLEIGTPAALAAEHCLSGSSATEALKLKVSVAAMGGITFTDASGKTLWKGITLSSWHKEGAVVDGEGKQVCISKGKTTGLGKVQMRLLRTRPSFNGQESKDMPTDKKVQTPLYEFGVVETKQTLGGAKGTYGIYTPSGTAPLFKGERLKSMKQRYVVATTDEVVVAKVWQSDTFGRKFEAEIAAGVDPIAITTLVSSLAPGGGAAVGGMVGAGAV